MSECIHKWVFRESTRRKEDDYGYRQALYKKTDFYYCEKCLEEVQKDKSECKMEGPPDWY